MAQGGKSYNDRLLAARVRTKALKEIEAILDEPGLTEYKKQLLLKLAATLLPRLNEHTGEDGKDLPTPILGYVIPGENVEKKDTILDHVCQVENTQEVKKQERELV